MIGHKDNDDDPAHTWLCGQIHSVFDKLRAPDGGRSDWKLACEWCRGLGWDRATHSQISAMHV